MRRLLCVGLVVTGTCLFPAAAAAAEPEMVPVGETSLTDAIKQSKTFRSAVSGLTECAQMAERLSKDKALLRELDKFKAFLDKLGKALTVASVAKNTTQAYRTGEIDGLIDDAQGLAVTKAGCAAFGIFCPAWTAGMGIGTIINYAPKAFGSDNPTLNDMWTDYLVTKLYPEPKKEDLLRGIAEFKAKIRQAESEAAAAEARKAQCMVDENTAAALPRRSGNKATARLSERTTDEDLAARERERAEASQAIDAERHRVNANANNLLGVITDVAVQTGTAYVAGQQTQPSSPYAVPVSPSPTGVAAEGCIAGPGICDQIYVMPPK